MVHQRINEIYVRRLRDETVAEKYKRGLAESLGEPNVSDDPENL